MTDIIEGGVIELGIQYVKRYYHSDNMCRSILYVLFAAAEKIPQIIIEDDCLKMLQRFVNCENHGYSHLACCLLANILADPNSDLSQEVKSAISDKMESAIQAWRGDWSMTQEGFSDVKSLAANEQCLVLQRLAAWVFKYFRTNNHPHYVPIIVKEVGWQTLSSIYLNVSLALTLISLRFNQERVDSMSVLQDLDHNHVGDTVQGRQDITEQDCKMIEIALAPVLVLLNNAWCDSQELLRHCQELYTKHILFIMEFVSRLGSVSENVIYGIWQIAMYIETALDDHSPFVDRGMVEWGVTCIQTYQHNEDLVFRVLYILDSIAETYPIALLEMNTLERLKQLVSDRRPILSVRACITLAKLVSTSDLDISQHDITSISDIMRQAIPLWDFDSDIGIELLSFTDIKSWLMNEKLPPVQQFAASGIYYFIRRDASKYIPLMEKDVGLETLKELSSRTYLSPETRHVLQRIMRLHESHQKNQSVVFDEDNICRFM